MQKVKNNHILASLVIATRFNAQVTSKDGTTKELDGRYIVVPFIVNSGHPKNGFNIHPHPDFDISLTKELAGAVDLNSVEYDPETRRLEFPIGENTVSLTPVPAKKVQDVKDWLELAVIFDDLISEAHVRDLINGIRHESQYDEETIEEVIYPFLKKKHPTMSLDWNSFKNISDAFVEYDNMADAMYDLGYRDEEAFANAFDFKRTSGGHVVVIENL